MQTLGNLKIVDAQPRHAPFIAWVILTAFRSHLEKGFWDFIRPGSDAQLLRYLEALTTSKAPHWTHLPLFLVAEVDGEPAAALSGYFDEEHGGMRLRDGMDEADAATAQTADAEALARALTILNVAPEHVPRAWIIEDVATRPQFRRRGLVDVLMQEIMERGRRRGATVSDIGVFIGNDSAQPAYEKAGYVVVDEKRDAQFEAVYETPGVRTLRRAL
ncbi:MAG: GNAT family N-acetyltransferase [Deltaproteobacteria bacterium]|nr:GNAT family N-acetyltransferase [Deltaproteobacteria bacterium]